MSVLLVFLLPLGDTRRKSRPQPEALQLSLFRQWLCVLNAKTRSACTVQIELEARQHRAVCAQASAGGVDFEIAHVTSVASGIQRPLAGALLSRFPSPPAHWPTTRNRHL